MTIAVDATKENLLLADAMSTRLQADSAFVGSRAAFWRYVGVGSILAAVGLASGLGFYAYSRIQKVQVTQEMLVEAMKKTFETVTLQSETTGEVSVKGTVSMAYGQVVGIDPSSTVGIDPDASVKVTGQIRIDAPTPPPPPVSSGSRSTAATRSMVTNFTVFKTVDFGKGKVQTGWMFATSNQREPTRQYCMYLESLGDAATQAQVIVGADGRMVSQSRRRSAFDVVAAFNNCVWFNGSL